MTQIELIVKEIAYSGKCYLICREYDAADFEGLADEQLRHALALGACELNIGFSDGALADQTEIAIAGMDFSYYSDFDVLRKRLRPEDGPALRMKRLTADNAPLFAALYNEAFLTVPNAATIDAPELERLLGGACEAGFFMWGGDPLGVFELDFPAEEAASPEIAALAIRPDKQGAGYGRMTLRALERRLLMRGDASVQLIVATANERAYSLYRACGYQKKNRLSRWFSAKPGSAG